MSLVIKTNVASLEAQRNLSKAQSGLQANFNKLSSGLRIGSAKDDAAGLAISESLKSQIRSLTVAERNASDGIGMAETAEAALGEISGIVLRLREVATQAANGSLQSADRDFLQTEFKGLADEMNRVVTSAKFNGHRVLEWPSPSAIEFQVGIRNDESDRIAVDFGLTSAAPRGAPWFWSVSKPSFVRVNGSAGNARFALDVLDATLQEVSRVRARFGAVLNRFEASISNIQSERANLAAATSRIRDLDVADEAATLSRNQVLAQSATSVLSQANQSPQLALSLLRG